MLRKPSIFSFFSGSGLLDLGFETEGFRTVYVNESYEPFLKAYKYSREKLRTAPPEYGYYDGSITDFENPRLDRTLADLLVDARRGGSVAGFIGGPPCPDFSVGGKNRGRHGDRGKLSGTYISLVCKHKPDFFLFENVRGLWRTKVHRAFYEELKQMLEEAGYALTERLTNAIEYGAPQDRDRIILLGFRDPKLKSKFRIFPGSTHARFPNRSAFAMNGRVLRLSMS